MNPTVFFWVSTAVLAYTYIGIGFPTLMPALAHVRPRAVRRGPIRPTLSFVIVAHNEAPRIGRKLEAALVLEYTREQLEILVASDGSTDRTEIARRSDGPQRGHAEAPSRPRRPSRQVRYGRVT